jgi:outer membrane protein OmpA-like peptidoglycan-associated protein
MRRIFFTAQFVFAFTCIFSQNVWLEDDFKDNRNGWEILSEEFLKTSVKNGQYVIDKLSVERFQTLKKIYIDPNRDFIVSCEMLIQGQNDKNEYGLVWGVKDLNNCNVFTICSAGNILIKQVKDEKVNVLYKANLPKLVHSDKKQNSFNITQKADQISFSLNDSLLFTTSSSKFPFYKPNFGFEITGYSKVSVLSVSLKQDNVIKLLENMPKGMQKKNLGPNINSKFNEAAPNISADGKALYWAVKGDPKNVNVDFYDIWYSTALSDTAWNKRKNIGKPLNNENHNWVISVSPDNNMLVVSNRYNKDGSFKPEIGISKAMRTKTGWNIPTAINISEFDNLSKFANYCLAPDGKAMVMAIETQESEGDLDLYVSFLQNDTLWTKPKHIKNVSSFGKECAPFIAADGTTMYFSTNGRPGYGDNDIFVTTRKDSTWLNWSEPCNLGPEINTPNFDADYSMPASGAFALMVSKDHAIGGSDIFRIDLPKQAKPKPVILIKGKVINEVTKQPIVANISYFDLLTDQEVGIAVSSPVDGSYNIVLPPGTDYSMMARKEGYISESEHIYAIEIAEYTEMEKDLLLIPLEVGVTVQLHNIIFETGKGVIKEESSDELNKLLKLLIENPSVDIEISGHTDNVGADEANLTLSRERAVAIKKFLELGGIDSKRLTAVGYGRTKPVTTNDTEEGRAQNRRVEFKIVKK